MAPQKWKGYERFTKAHLLAIFFRDFDHGDCLGTAHELGRFSHGSIGSAHFNNRMDERGFIMKRRSFLCKGVGGLAGLAGLAALIPGLGFFFAPFAQKKEEKWEPVGKVDDFKTGTTTEVSFEDPSPLPWAGVVAKSAAWLRRDPDGNFVAFSVNCTHLGCPVDWEADAELFMCPCHGGVYTKDGEVAGGPPPRALTRYQVRTAGENVEIRTAELPLA
jgi:menaquinol-cytochrome c reductase iron-sulfur subunit